MLRALRIVAASGSVSQYARQNFVARVENETLPVPSSEANLRALLVDLVDDLADLDRLGAGVLRELGQAGGHAAVDALRLVHVAVLVAAAARSTRVSAPLC